MPTTAVDTVTVDREALLDAVGWLFAADEIFVALNGNTDSSPGQLFREAACSLRATFNEDPESDGEYERDPVIVDTDARGYEHAVEAIDALADGRELARSFTSDELSAIRFDLEERATEIRRVGSIGG